MKPSRIEQETVILYNEAELTAEVYTCDKKLLEKLERLEGKYPEKIVKKSEQTYIVPKACVLIREPYSEQRRAAARERAKAGGFVPPCRRNVF